MWYNKLTLFRKDGEILVVKIACQLFETCVPGDTEKIGITYAGQVGNAYLFKVSIDEVEVEDFAVKYEEEKMRVVWRNNSVENWVMFTEKEREEIQDFIECEIRKFLKAVL